MSWSKIDDKLHGHPKVVNASLEAMGLWTLALSWCASYLTDGAIPGPQVARLGGNHDIAQELVSVGLWEETDDGYQVHDYHDYNPSAEKVKQTRAARAEAGRKGGETSKPPEQETEPAGDDYEKAKEEAKPKQTGSKTEAKEEAKSNPVPVPDPVPNSEPKPGKNHGGKPPEPPPEPHETVDFDTPEARKLKARLQATAKAKGRRGPLHFETLEQKRRFLKAVKALGSEFDAMLTKAMEAGCTSRARTIDYIVGCSKNKGKPPPRYGRRADTRAPVVTLAEMPDVPDDGEPILPPPDAVGAGAS